MSDAPRADAPAYAPAHARLDAALAAVTVAAKAATIVCAVDALINANSPRLRGKAIRTRALGYTAALFIVPVAWRFLPNRGSYPHELDLAVTTPLLLDAGGQRARAVRARPHR